MKNQRRFLLLGILICTCGLVVGAWSLQSSSATARAPVEPPSRPGERAWESGAVRPSSNGAATTFGTLFRLNNSETWADAVLPGPNGYRVLSDYAFTDGFTLNLTEFDPYGYPLGSTNFSVTPVLANTLANTVRATGDGGFLIGHYTDWGGSREGRLVKFNSDLSVAWSKAYVGSESVEGVAETADGGLVAVLTVGSSQGIAITKLNADGSIVWQKLLQPHLQPGVDAESAYDVYENTYLDAGGQARCGGYVVYGIVRRATTSWDLYLAAISCDGANLYWQRLVSGPDWDGAQPLSGGGWFSRATNLVQLRDRNGLNTQSADLLVAATTHSYGTDEAIMLVPFTISGTTSLSFQPHVGPVKLLDGPDAERFVGPFGGPDMIRLSDGSPLLAGSIYKPTSGESRALLVKLDAGLNVSWQYTYSQEEMLSLYESSSGIVAAGGGPAGMLLHLTADGMGTGVCGDRQAAQLAVSSVSPDVSTPTYNLQNGSLTVTNEAVTTSQAAIDVTCPYRVYVPDAQHDAP